MSLPSRTILGDLGKEEAISAAHPLFYTKQRSHYLDRLTQQVTAETELPTVDLRRNMRVDQYLSQYNGLRTQQIKQQKVQNTLLRAGQFQSIFQDEEAKLRQQHRTARQNRTIQDALYKNYVEEVNFYQPAEKDQQLDERAETILTLGGDRMKELYLIDLEIGRLKQQQRVERVVRERQESCRNNTLLGRLSSSIISSYMVYFDEIYALLIDEIIEEEVIFLNQLEADYKVNKHTPIPTKLENKQTLQMIELVKSLEELCDD